MTLLHFEPVSLQKKTEYYQRFSQVLQKCSDYSLVNLWGWKEAYDLEWAWDNRWVWIRQTRPTTAFWAPVGAWENIDWLHTLQEIDATGATFTRIPEKLLMQWESIFSGYLRVEEERGNWDYLYRVEELVDLKGNRFHKKKNLVNQFMKKYPYRFIHLDADRVGEALLLQENWCTWRDCESSESLGSENTAISRVLENFDQFDDLLGGGIVCDGKMIAYTIGEKLDDETLLIHFEKGDPDFIGVYQAVNQLFLASYKDRFRLVNREQDLNDPGLRKAKMSYHPIDFVRKYRVSFERATKDFQNRHPES